MAAERSAIAEQIQREVARLVATLPVGVGLCLIGGFRYRLLDRLRIDPANVRRRLNDLGRSAARHAAAIDAVIQGQIDPASAVLARYPATVQRAVRSLLEEAAKARE
jgi:hypothetical protein